MSPEPSDAAIAPIRRHLQELAPIPEPEWNFFKSQLRAQRVAKGTLLLREGDVEDRVRFLARGVVRLFCSHEAREINLGFDCAGRWVGAYDSLVAHTPSLFAIESLGACEIVWFDGALLERLYARHPCWERAGRRILEEQYARKVRKETEIRVLSPGERYALLLRRDGGFLARVPQYHLASYLGIAPETLSRIRGRLA